MSRAEPAARSVLISLDGRSPAVELPDGDSVRFGWRAGEITVGTDRALTAGRIDAFGDYWLMSNCGAAGTYCVENLEGAGEYVKVRAGRAGVPIPFELSRVTLTVGAGSNSFTVYAPERRATVEPDGGGIPLLDEESRYFQVLVCLCEPRLRDCGAAAVPTPAQVSARLSAAGVPLGRSAVNYHIDYLVKKLGTTAPRGMTRAWKRDTVVTLALKFDLVRPEHLGLIPGRVAGRVPGRGPGRFAEGGRPAGRPALHV
ncbi:serine/threonine protein kinase [Kitasatospora purpeofusca]|uniref:serine/threonine protein kinase n=1 Tax=Kitasatospora purpeofusca TaxID=67352 RepID=UPI0036E2B5F4